MAAYARITRLAFQLTMSKPLSPNIRLNLTSIDPGALVRHTVRLGLYWLCATLLLWPSMNSLGEWRALSVLFFMAISSLIVPTLGYLALLLRGRTAYPPSHKLAPSFVQTLSHTGIIAVELLIVLLAAAAVQRLLF